jgi:hypothetical protein
MVQHLVESILKIVCHLCEVCRRSPLFDSNLLAVQQGKIQPLDWERGRLARNEGEARTASLTIYSLLIELNKSG